VAGELFDQAGNRKYLTHDERKAFLKAADRAPREMASFGTTKALPAPSRRPNRGMESRAAASFRNSPSLLLNWQARCRKCQLLAFNPSPAEGHPGKARTCDTARLRGVRLPPEAFLFYVASDIAAARRKAQSVHLPR